MRWVGVTQCPFMGTRKQNVGPGRKGCDCDAGRASITFLSGISFEQ